MDLVLINEDIFLKGGNRSISQEFIAPIVVLGGFGENFDDDAGVEDGVGAIVQELGIPLDHQHIGVGVAIVAGDGNAEISNKGASACTPQCSLEEGKEVACNAVVVEGASGQGDDGSVVVFAAVFGGLLQGEVLGGGVVAGGGGGRHGDWGGGG